MTESLCVMCNCRCLLKKSGCRTPRIELEEIGPSFDLVLRRTHLASDDLYKLAHRQPKALKVKLIWMKQSPRIFLQRLSCPPLMVMCNGAVLG